MKSKRLKLFEVVNGAIMTLLFLIPIVIGGIYQEALTQQSVCLLMANTIIFLLFVAMLSINSLNKKIIVFELLDKVLDILNKGINKLPETYAIYYVIAMLVTSPFVIFLYYTATVFQLIVAFTNIFIKSVTWFFNLIRIRI